MTEEDIPVLLSIGKDQLYVWEKDETMYHEDEAAAILRDMSMGEHMRASEPKEGKIELTAECSGLFTVDEERLLAVNSLGEMTIATRHGNFPVKPGDKLAGMRVIPLVIEKEKMARAQEVAGNTPLLALHPYHHKKVGIVTTGNEVYYGRIQDKFGPMIRRKLAEYDTEVLGQTILNDDPERITAAIQAFHRPKEPDLVCCTGGMSVDPDDTTPAAIQNTGAKIISYGAPVLPGSYVSSSYTRSGHPDHGTSGCVMYAEAYDF